MKIARFAYNGGIHEYMSEFMTLNEGDLIWSGTPEGISHIYAGDTVVCEIEGIGRLENQLVAEKLFYK